MLYSRHMVPAFFRLLVRTFLTGFAASRISLVFHELVGHGLAILAVGAKVIAPHLTFFGSGSIGYERDTAFNPIELRVIASGGLVAQLLVGFGALLWLQRAKHRGLRFFLMSMAAINFIFVSYALVVSIDYRYGDVWGMIQPGAEARLWVIGLGVLLTLGNGLYFGQMFVGEALGFVPFNTFGKRTLTIGFSVLVTAALQFTLLRLEAWLAPEPEAYISRPTQPSSPVIGIWIWVILAAALSLSALYRLWRESMRSETSYSSFRTP